MMSHRLGLTVAVLFLLCLAQAPAFAMEDASLSEVKTVEEFAGELSTGQKVSNILTFPFRLVGYIVYYPLKFFFYDIWAWLFDALFGPGDPSTGDLIDRLKDPKAQIRGEAARELGRLRAKEALDPLIDRFSDPDEGVRAECVRAVGRIGSDSCSKRLLEMAARGQTLGERAAAVQALGLLEEEAAVSLLLDLLKHKDWILRYHSANALGNIGHVAAGPALAQSLTDREYRVRGAAARALGRLGDPASLKALRKAFGTLKGEGSIVRASIIEALGRVGGEAEARLIYDFMKSSDAVKDPFSRGAAAHVLGGMGYTRATGDLEKMLLGEESQYVIYGAAAGLADLGVIAPLQAAVRSRNPYTRIAAAMGLGRLDGPDASEGLVTLAGDPFISVRRAAIIGLLSRGHSRAVELVITQLTVPSPQMRAWALEVLKNLAGEDHGLDTKAWEAWWKENRDKVDPARLFPRQEKPGRKKLSRREKAMSRKMWARAGAASRS